MNTLHVVCNLVQLLLFKLLQDQYIYTLVIYAGLKIYYFRIHKLQKQKKTNSNFDNNPKLQFLDTRAY